MKHLFIAVTGYLAVAVSSASDPSAINVEALAARVKELEQFKEATTPTRQLYDAPLDLSPQSLGAARRTSFHYQSRRHQLMKERYERQTAEGRRRLDDSFVDFDEFCWSLDNVWVRAIYLVADHSRQHRSSWLDSFAFFFKVASACSKPALAALKTLRTSCLRT